MPSNVKIILHRTSHPGNIGAAARAMKTMGLDRLVLVKPDLFPDERATVRAAGADDILLKAECCDTLDQAIADCEYVIGTSARLRSLPGQMLNPRQCGELVNLAIKNHNKIGIVFGREDSGLSNQDLEKCHYHLHIPVNPEYSSLNLAAAVQVICYEIRMAGQEEDGDGLNHPYHPEPLATAKQVEQYMTHLERVLTELDFLKPHQPTMLMQRLRRFYNRARVETVEYNILRGILTAIDKKLTAD